MLVAKEEDFQMVVAQILLLSFLQLTVLVSELI